MFQFSVFFFLNDTKRNDTNPRFLVLQHNFIKHLNCYQSTVTSDFFLAHVFTSSFFLCTGKFFAATVWFFTNISGPLTTNSSGIIQNINCNFSLSLLGYTAAELKDKVGRTFKLDLYFNVKLFKFTLNKTVRVYEN